MQGCQEVRLQLHVDHIKIIGAVTPDRAQQSENRVFNFEQNYKYCQPQHILINSINKRHILLHVI